MKPAHAIGFAAAGLALLYFARPKSQVTTEETYGLGPTSYPESLQQFGRAIARAEGFYVGGSIPERANNPGNLKIPNWSGPSINGISVFDSADQGFAALYRQLWLIVEGKSQYYNLDMTIKQMGDTWEADPGDAWSHNVASALGVSVDDPLWTVLV